MKYEKRASLCVVYCRRVPVEMYSVRFSSRIVGVEGTGNWFVESSQ